MRAARRRTNEVRSRESRTEPLPSSTLTPRLPSSLVVYQRAAEQRLARERGLEAEEDEGRAEQETEDGAARVPRREVGGDGEEVEHEDEELREEHRQQPAAEQDEEHQRRRHGRARQIDREVLARQPARQREEHPDHAG